jgi:hypothetical protein
MFSKCRIGSLCWLLAAVATLCGCAAAPPTKMQCESNLRPINPSSLEDPHS